MHFPTWVDLKGEDAVPETVHHVVVKVDPQQDRSWETLRRHVLTDGVHARDNVRPGNNTAGNMCPIDFCHGVHVFEQVILLIYNFCFRNSLRGC